MPTKDHNYTRWEPWRMTKVKWWEKRVTQCDTSMVFTLPIQDNCLNFRVIVFFFLFAGVLWCITFLEFIYYFSWGMVHSDALTGCKFSYFLHYFTTHYSSSLLVIMSVEKCLALYFPFKTKSICTVKIAKRVTLVTTLMFVAFDSQFFYYH